MKDNNYSRSLFLKIAREEYNRKRKMRIFLIKSFFIFFVLGFIAGYSAAMIDVTGDFWWYPGKNYGK